jgi:hypothetical protein
VRPREIYETIRAAVGPLLAENGFSSAGSKGGTYYRVIDDDLSHFILFDLFQHQEALDIKVFPSTRRLGESYWSGFPDSVAIVSGNAA